VVAKAEKEKRKEEEEEEEEEENHTVFEKWAALGSGLGP
jgi:hypothetical protein